LTRKENSEVAKWYGLVVWCILGLAAPGELAGGSEGSIIVSESGDGLEHRVIVDAPERFRLVFEASKNYGITQWFDLAGDPKAKTDLLHNPTDYIPEHSQGAIFNQCLNPDDLIAHVASAGGLHRDCPRSIQIHQRGSESAVIECSYSPVLGKANPDLVFRTHYTITSDGRILVRNTMSSRTDQKLTMWRNAIITLGDPTYLTRNVAELEGTLEAPEVLRVAEADWRDGEWAGYVAKQDSYRAYGIVGNTTNTLTVKPRHPDKRPSSGKLAIESNSIV
jgi:hypothetical protein